MEVRTELGSRFAWIRRGEGFGSTHGGDLTLGLVWAEYIEDVIVRFPDGELVRSGPVTSPSSLIVISASSG